MSTKQLEAKMKEEAKLIDKAVANEKIKKSKSTKLPIPSKKRFELEF
ncbi:hypothetical protein [Fulvivirga sp.]